MCEFCPATGTGSCGVCGYSRDEAAAALDLTHAIGERGPRTYNARQRVAAALDAGRVPLKKDIEWLLNVAKLAS